MLHNISLLSIEISIMLINPEKNKGTLIAVTNSLLSLVCSFSLIISYNYIQCGLFLF